MTALTPSQLAALARFGFDPVQFADWQRRVRTGDFAKAKNAVTSPLLPPPPGAVAELPPPGSAAHAALTALGQSAIARGELGVVVLNGGMATRFGGVVKGVVPVLGDARSFLGLVCEDLRAAEQSCGGRIPLYLMNSFATDEATKAHFAQHHDFGLAKGQVHHFTQFVSVRMQPDGALFVGKDGQPSWYGPGHGDFAPAFRRHCLPGFLQAGGRHVFVRNVDNIGARVSPAVLGHHLQQRAEATVELVTKWPGDVGGAPYLFEGKVQLVEQIRYPQGFDAGIVDVFNCNTFTFDAKALDREFALGRYYVEKTVDGRKAVQIEHLIGELSGALRSTFLKVGREGLQNRFQPVKEPEDLVKARAQIAAIYGAGTAAT